MGVVCGAVVALAACSAAPEPTQTGTVPAPPTSSETPTRTPTPTATTTSMVAPTHPPEWETGNNAGALAAATYFMELYNYVNATGDLTEWDAVSDPGCEYCAAVHDDVEGTYDAGGRFDGGEITVSGGTVVGFEESLRIHGVQFAYATAATSQLNPDGSVARTWSPEVGYVVVDVGYDGSGWKLVGATASQRSLVP